MTSSQSTEACGVRAGNRVGMRVRDARDERADERVAPAKRGVDGRRQVNESGLRLVLQDVESERPDRAVPAHDVERRDEGKALDEGVVFLHEDARGTGPRSGEDLSL